MKITPKIMEDFSSPLISLLTAAGLAGLIGLEREMRVQNEEPDGSNLGGLRTYSMMGALGFLASFMSIKFEISWFLPLIFIGSFMFLFISHTLVAIFQRQFGITSQLSLIASFLVGILIAFDLLYLAIAVSVLFTGLLVLKIGLHSIAKKINREELLAILKFFIFSAIILPLLPAHWIDPFEFFDWRPQTIWLMVILVASIRFVGYFLSKFFSSEKSILFSGIVGGFVSSTALTMGISQQSEGKRRVILFLIPILLASALMFFRVILEVSLTTGRERDLLLTIVPILGTAGLAFVIVALGLLIKRAHDIKGKSDIKTSIEIDQPLQMKSAISFGIFFLVIFLLSDKIAEFFSDSGLLFAGAVAGLTDVDAITLAMANLQKSGEISTNLASQVILLAVMVNTLVKAGIVFLFGSKKLFQAVLLSVIGIITLGAGLYFLL